MTECIPIQLFQDDTLLERREEKQKVNIIKNKT